MAARDMTRAEVNAHPSIAPLLAAWREARAHRDAVLCDGRFGMATRKAAETAAEEARKVYDAAVERLLSGGAS